MTAVDWIQQQIDIHIDEFSSIPDYDGLKHLISKAKEIEKVQIQDAHYEGQCDNHEGYPKYISEQYYKETYGKE